MAGSHAQSPQAINFQAVARDNAGNILVNQPISIRLSILSGSITGTAAYVETHSKITDNYGMFALQIGMGTMQSGTFITINWVANSYFLKVEIDPAGGSDYIVAGRSQFVSVPYALHATTADNGFSGNYNDLSNRPLLFDGNFSSLNARPSTLAGYGISDAMHTSHAANGITTSNISTWDTAYSWGNHAGLYRPISYVPSWGEITSKPAFATVATSGSYNDLNNKPVLFDWSFDSLVNKPTTLAGYGITDAMNTSHAANGITTTNIYNWDTAYSWGNHVGLYRPISYVPSWVEITSKPAFATVATSGSYNDLNNKPVLFDGSFESLVNKPTTLAGYGITDAMNTSHPANNITNSNITNWNTAYSWGNHAGLYRPISYVPSWTEITGKPTFATVATTGNYYDLTNKPTGQNPGDMLYWNGTQWVNVPAGTNGQVLTFNNGVPTWGAGQIPIVYSVPASQILSTTAVSGGSIGSQGSAAITARGVCWSTTANPTIAGSHTTDGSGSGDFVSNISGLSPNTQYHLRAYASNVAGTAYSNDIVFTTLATCGTSLAISHPVVAGVAPVSKIIIYGTVTNIAGETTKCWITSNLGADRQATAVSDATEASAGWYWQFNRRQGFKHDGTTRTPGTTWITTIIESSDWIATNDPCSLELGTSWRLPTSTEWTNVDATGNWTSWAGPWNSALKLHAAGCLVATDASLSYRGTSGFYQSSVQNDANYGRYLYFYSTSSVMNFNSKAYGFSVRCIRDN